MSYTYLQRKRSDRANASKQPVPARNGMDALRSGAVQPTREQMGHRVDLPDAMREKMENAFGADLSAVKLYESETVRDAGVEAVTQGSNIAFAPGMLDLTSYGGQALLGHEISHVVSQARGEVTGSGLLNDHALEARADREGAMAAAGQQIAVPAAAMSSVTAAPASGPMQCSGKAEKRAAKRVDKMYQLGTMYQIPAAPDGSLPYTKKDASRLNKMLFSMNDLELAMMQQRALQSAIGVYDYDQQLQSQNLPKEEHDYRVAMSDPSLDQGVYSNLLEVFAGGPHTKLADSKKNEKFATRFVNSATWAERQLSPEDKMKVQRGQSLGSTLQSNSFALTDDARAIDAVQVAKRKELFKKGKSLF